MLRERGRHFTGAHARFFLQSPEEMGFEGGDRDPSSEA
jgi:hypothetical protein